MIRTSTKKRIRTFDDYERDAARFLKRFAAFVTDKFGERCKPTDPDCACCKMWKLYDQTVKLLDI